MSEILTSHLNAPSIALSKLNKLDKIESYPKEIKNEPVKSKDEVTEAADKPENLKISTKQLEKVAQQLQDFVGDMNKGLEFLVDKESGRDVIKVIDKKSGETVKQYPSEEVLGLVAKLSEVTGLFVNSEV